MSYHKAHVSGLPGGSKINMRGEGRVKVIAVPCLDCEAEVNEPCTSPTGKKISAGHTSRRRMAVRKQLEERESHEDH